MTSPDQTLGGGALNAAISNAVVGLLSQYVGKGPPKARAIHSGKIVLCVLEDTMTTAERNLVAGGRENFVLEMRHVMQDTMRKDLTDTVEALTRRKVVAFMSANHINPDLAAEVFVLDEPVIEEVEVVGSDSSDVNGRTAAAASRDGRQPFSRHEIRTTTRGDNRRAPASNDAERWLDDGGSFSSRAVALSGTPSG